MKQVILGTAGHIDHGKTALIKALTGVDTDRLKEERERGITIDLGFAHLDVGEEISVGIVDVPGHERFVKNMLAGAGGIDLVALIIAADEGVMPQTREHMAICELLHIKTGLVVITKTDLVDEEWLALVEEDVRDFLKGTFLQDCPMVFTSSRTGEGLDELLSHLTSLANEVEPKRASGPFRMPIDRVFTMKGFGTVVTGTLTSGSASVEEQVEVFPHHLTSRIRSIQVHNRSVAQALAGQRTAFNLSGVEKSSIIRGDVLSLPGRLLPTTLLDARMTLLETAPHPVKNRARLRFHHGTAEIMARVVLLEGDLLEPGGEAFVQLLLERPVSALPRDRFVVRSYSPVITIAGGQILEVKTVRHRRSRREVLDHLKVLEQGSQAEVLEALLAYAGQSGLTMEELFPRFDLAQDEIAGLVKGLSDQGVAIHIDDDKLMVMHRRHFEAMSESIVEHLSSFHKQNPLKPGMGREELRGRVAPSAERAFAKCTEFLEADGKVTVERDLMRLSSHKVELQEDQAKLKGRLEQQFLDTGYQPPSPQEAFGRLSISEQAGREMLQVLIDQGALVRLKDKVIYHSDNLNKAREMLIGFLKENGEITAAQFRDLLDVSRKYAIPLLEYFDNQRITFRKGDVRVLRSKN
jgi:selenocysteine-specific elongation factor